MLNDCVLLAILVLIATGCLLGRGTCGFVCWVVVLTGLLGIGCFVGVWCV